MHGAHTIYHANTFTYQLYSWKQSVLNFGSSLYQYGMQTYRWITYASQLYISYLAIAHFIISWGKLLLIASFTGHVLCSFLSNLRLRIMLWLHSKSKSLRLTVQLRISHNQDIDVILTDLHMLLTVCKKHEWLINYFILLRIQCIENI